MTVHLTAAESAAADRLESSMRALQHESVTRIEVASKQPRRIRERRRQNLLRLLTQSRAPKSTGVDRQINAGQDDTLVSLITGLWSSWDKELVPTRRGGSLPTNDLTIPELTKLGYLPSVEVEVDVDSAGNAATLTFLLEPKPGAQVSRLRVIAETSSGFSRASTVTSGTAKLSGIPSSELQDLTLRWVAA